MKIDLDDPKLTAYALDGLRPEEREAMHAAVEDSPEAKAYIAEIRALTRNLRAEYEEERGSQPREAAPVPVRLSRWTPGRRLALAATFAVFAAVGAMMVTTFRRPEVRNQIAQFRDQSAEPSGDKLLNDGKTEGLGAVATTDRTIVTGSTIPTAEEVAPSPPLTESDELAADVVLSEPAAPPAAPLAVSPHQFADMRAGMSPAAPALKSTRARSAKSAPSSQAYVEYGNTLEGAGQPARAAAAQSASAPMEFAETADDARRNDPNGRLGQLYQSGPSNTASYDHIIENPFLPAATNPLSTFSTDVDTASYANARRFIDQGSLPPKDAVRVEEFINYFTYNYPQPDSEHPFSVNLEATQCPWAPAHRLVRVGLKGREIAMNQRPPSNLVFLLDVSGSMTPPERLPLVKQAMRLLVNQLTETDRVAIVVYAGQSGLALPSTNGLQKDKILSALENLQSGGSTHGAEGIELAYKVAADNFIKGGVNRVILATDGDFNVGITNQGDLVRLIQEKAKSGVFLSVLGVGDDNLKDSTMVKLANKGNGNYAYLDSVEEARKVLVQQMSSTLVTIAKDVKIQIEFNPARVASYRLVGYEKRMLRKEDFNNDKIDAGEIGAGHTVTALYEIVPAGAAVDPAGNVPPVDPLKYGTNPTDVTPAAEKRSTAASSEMLTAKLRYKKPDGDKSELLERSLVDQGSSFANASPDFKFAAAVAEFGMILRDSEHKGNGTLGAVMEWAQEGKGSDPEGYRAGFIELVRKAQALAPRR